MSPSVLTSLKREVITTKDGVSHINHELLDIYRGRHFLIFDRDLRPGDKTDWARRQVSEIRRLNQQLSHWTTAKQLENIAHGMFLILTKEDPDKQRAGLDGLKGKIYIDTRSSLGRPKAWTGMPVTPLPHAKASFQRLPNDQWTLWIERAGVPESPLERLLPSDISGSIRPPKRDEPLPWWVRSPEVIDALGRNDWF
jgi:hypothetical protein